AAEGEDHAVQRCLPERGVGEQGGIVGQADEPVLTGPEQVLRPQRVPDGDQERHLGDDDGEDQRRKQRGAPAPAFGTVECGTRVDGSAAERLTAIVPRSKGGGAHDSSSWSAW